MEQDKDSEMKKHILDSIIQNANKLMGDKLKGKPAAMVVDIKAAHPVDPEDMMSASPDMDSDEPSDDSKDKLLQLLHPELAHSDEMDDDEDSESPQDKLLEALHPEMSSDHMSDEDDNEPSDELKKLIELHLMKKGKI